MEKTPKERLLIALRKGHPERMMALIKQFPDELSVDLAADTAENRLLHRAARYGHAAVVTALLENGADPAVTNKFGMTALHHAAVHGGHEVIKALIEGGCAVNQADDAGRLPLHWTATKGHVLGAKELIKGGAKPTGADKEGFTPLHRCAQEEPEEKKGGEETEPEPEEETQKRLMEQQRNKAEIAEELLRLKAHVSARDLKGQQTPLHLAAMNGLEVVGQVLLDNGANVDATNKIGQTPLIYACIEQHVGMVKLLLKYGANPCLGNPLHWDWAPLHWAALADNVELVQIILDGGGKNVPDRTGRVPGTLAEEHGKSLVLDILNSLPRAN